MAARIRLIIAWGLFAAWVAWLSYQSFQFGRFPVVSRAQMANADVAVVAHISADAQGRALPAIKVDRVIWPQAPPANLAGQELNVANLSACSGFDQPGDYVVPLTKTPKGDYLLTEFGRSPLLPSRHSPPIYPAIEVVIQQVIKTAEPAVAP